MSLYGINIVICLCKSSDKHTLKHHFCLRQNIFFENSKYHPVIRLQPLDIKVYSILSEKNVNYRFTRISSMEGSRLCNTSNWSKSKVLYIVNLLVLSTRKNVHAINKTFNLFKHQINKTVLLLFCGSFFQY